MWWFRNHSASVSNCPSISFGWYTRILGPSWVPSIRAKLTKGCGWFILSFERESVEMNFNGTFAGPTEARAFDSIRNAEKLPVESTVSWCNNVGAVVFSRDTDATEVVVTWTGDKPAFRGAPPVCEFLSVPEKKDGIGNEGFRIPYVISLTENAYDPIL